MGRRNRINREVETGKTKNEKVLVGGKEKRSKKKAPTLSRPVSDWGGGNSLRQKLSQVLSGKGQIRKKATPQEKGKTLPIREKGKQTQRKKKGKEGSELVQNVKARPIF